MERLFSNLFTLRPVSGANGPEGSMLRTAIDPCDPSRFGEITHRVTETLLSEFGTGAVEGATQALLVTAERLLH